MQQSRPREIRSLIAQLFAEIEPGVHQVDRETLLIRDGQYCGHRYQTGRLTAVWFLEENQIKIHDESGQVLRVVSPTTEVRTGQQAA